MHNLEKEFKEIDSKIQPSEDFISSLKDNVIKTAEKRNKKRYHDIAMIAACFAIIFISGGVFAQDLGDLMSKIFSNVNKGIEMAIDNNYIQKVDMDYIVENGVGIKVDHIIVDNNNISIEFNIKTEEEFDEIYFNEIHILDEKYNSIYNTRDVQGEIYDINQVSDSVNIKNKLLSKKQLIKIYMFGSIFDKYMEYKELNININKIAIIKGSHENIMMGNWSFKIQLDEGILTKSIVEYEIKETDILENYSINLTSTALNIELKFKESLNFKNKFEKNLSKKNQIWLEEKDGNKYYCNDYRFIDDDELKINFPITQFNNKDNLKLKINLENSELVFNIREIKKEEGVLE